MTTLRAFLLPALLATLPLTVSGDSFKDESRENFRRTHEGREFKEKFWDGNCEVERTLEKNGDYKEKRKCRLPSLQYQRAIAAYPPPRGPVSQNTAQGITIQGTIRISP